MNRRTVVLSPLATGLLGVGMAVPANSQTQEGAPAEVMPAEPAPAGAAPLAGCDSDAPPDAQPPEADLAGVTFQLTVARTDPERSRGLGGHPPLAETEGMLFVFEHPAHWAFWMKGMTFAIDIIWIESGQVVHVAGNVPPPAPGEPDRSLAVYAPPAPATYVLEVAAGFAERHGVTAGTPVTLRGV